MNSSLFTPPPVSPLTLFLIPKPEGLRKPETTLYLKLFESDFDKG